jgi:hypothetical protein
VCHSRHLTLAQRDLLATLSQHDRWRLNKILEDGGIPSRAKPVRAVFERFVEHKGLSVIEAERISDLALGA